MKILHLATHLNLGGISRYIETLGWEMTKYGHQVFCLSSGGELVQDLERKGIRCFTFPIRTKSELSPKLYRSLPKIVRLVRSEGFDILHAHTRVTQVLASWIRLLMDAPFVTTCHGFYKRRLGRRLFPCWGERVIAISALVGEELQRTHRVRAETIEVILNAVDVEGIRSRYRQQSSADTRRTLGIKNGSLVFGSVARLVADKGMDYLIQATSRLRQKGYEVHALIAGDGPEMKHLQELTRNLRLDEFVTFTGYVKDVAGPLAAMDIFVLPATWREGFGLSIVEAMSVGKPVVVTNIWALNTLVEQGVTGFLVEPKSTESLCDSLERFITNPKLRETVALNAFKMAEEQFSIGRMAKSIEAVYQKVLHETTVQQPRR